MLFIELGLEKSLEREHTIINQGSGLGLNFKMCLVNLNAHILGFSPSLARKKVYWVFPPEQQAPLSLCLIQLKIYSCVSCKDMMHNT